MQIQPKLVTSQLLDRLNELAELNPPAEEMSTALQQVMFRAQGLRNAEPAEYFGVQGICASLQGDVEGVVRAFETGLEKAGWTEFLFHNYATSLDDMGEYELAAGVACRGVAELRYSPEAMDMATTLALHAGDVRCAAEAKRAHDELVGEESGLAGLSEFIERAGADPQRLDRIGEVIREARRFLKANGPRRMLAMCRFADGQGGNPHLVLNYAPAEPSTRVAGLERALFEKLSETVVEDEVFDWMTIGLTRKKAHDNLVHAG